MSKQQPQKKDRYKGLSIFMAMLAIAGLGILVSQDTDSELNITSSNSQAISSPQVAPPQTLPSRIPTISSVESDLKKLPTDRENFFSPDPPKDLEGEKQQLIVPSQQKEPEHYFSHSSIGAFVVSLHRDQYGTIWCGTEDQGVFCTDSTHSDRWRHFTTKDGLGDDNAYAICSDQQGRIWVGHQFSGVSVFNGQSWKNFGCYNGPLGERVFDIACNPVNGDIWIATNVGLSRYSEQTRSWDYLTRAGWLPPRDSLSEMALHFDEVETIAFAEDGTLYVGTKTQGIGIGTPNDDYASWRIVKAPTSDNFSEKLTGRGIPSDQINDILVASDGTVFVATVRGLARSKDQGTTWDFVRGRDAVEKVKRSWDGPSKNWREPTVQLKETLLPEDYITALAEDDENRIWLAFRIEGLFVGHEGTKLNVALKPEDLGIQSSGDFVIMDILPTTDGSAVIAGYGNGDTGLQEIEIGLPRIVPKIVKPSYVARLNEVRNMPSEADTPTQEQLEHMREIALKSQISLTAEWGAYAGDDWQTKGDWVGRYGHGKAVLCAMDAPMDHVVGYGTHYSVKGFTGSNGEKGEALRHWCHKIRWEDRRVLYNPMIGYRRQADWDDHAEAYPLTHEGPDVWIEVEVHEGVHEIALYFFNKDGHSGRNRLRDYLIELKPHSNRERRAYNARSLATARVRNFWGGVYHKFAVTGPNRYWIKIACNDSFNTIISGVFCRQLAGDWMYDGWSLPWMGGVSYNAPDAQSDSTWSEPLQRAIDLWKSTLPSVDSAAVHVARPLRMLALRAAIGENAPKVLVDSWRWELKIWNEEDRKEFDEKMAAGFKAVKTNTEQMNRQTPQYLYEKYFKKTRNEKGSNK